MQQLTVRFPSLQSQDNSRVSLSSRDDAQQELVAAIHEEDLGVMRETREKIEAAGGPVEVTIDLTGSTYVNSSRLSCMGLIRNTAADTGGKAILLVDCPDVLGVLEVTKFDKLFDVRRRGKIAQL